MSIRVLRPGRILPVYDLEWNGACETCGCLISCDHSCDGESTPEQRKINGNTFSVIDVKCPNETCGDRIRCAPQVVDPMLCESEPTESNET